MQMIRLYTGSDGKSHIDTLKLEEHLELAELKPATGIAFRITQPGHFIDWHPAPRRQYVITLEGEAEIGLEDGTRHRLRAGDVNLAEDLTGKGHTTRVVSDVPRITATVPLD
jgi:quercetin dioxygenase-like cupin family protein